MRLNASSDRWIAGDTYESFMGRWSRQVADLFLDWLALPAGLDWLDVGCGTGALSDAICRRLQPHSLVGCDPSPDFVSFARNSIPDCPVTFIVANADNLPGDDFSFDVIVSGLVLNFLPEPVKALQLMKARLCPGGTLAAYVWDYAEGMQFLRIFWDEATALDPGASQLDEAYRFPLCQPDRLTDLFLRAGIEATATTSLQTYTLFRDFEDFWSPFRAGSGPAPSYVASLAADAQNELALRLKHRLHASSDRPTLLKATAFGVRGVRPRQGR